MCKPQGPLPHTMIDFWEMVWMMKSPIIIMLTNLDEPDVDVSLSPPLFLLLFRIAPLKQILMSYIWFYPPVPIFF